MININLVPPYIEQYIKCINDTKPKFDVDVWIQVGKNYRLKGMAEAMNLSDGHSAILLDADGEELHPNANVYGFNSERFVPSFLIFLN